MDFKSMDKSVAKLFVERYESEYNRSQAGFIPRTVVSFENTLSDKQKQSGLAKMLIQFGNSNIRWCMEVCTSVILSK